MILDVDGVYLTFELAALKRVVTKKLKKMTQSFQKLRSRISLAIAGAGLAMFAGVTTAKWESLRPKRFCAGVIDIQ